MKESINLALQKQQNPKSQSLSTKINQWIETENLDQCICGSSYCIPGLDASYCSNCKWMPHRPEKIRRILAENKLNSQLAHLTHSQLQFLLLSLKIKL
ncbi:hypothetical protein [Lyngbya sp. PCC 8106]|uniref:hypothetical protein n=1 Tax=Lyngbya sp. (strain PCC 8106) TaxID=313612 RepID=UPI0000EA9916|nr:hypothetical protein [Lyngbya sp. PCC 8106]EAW35148.1 hypothetical protein L8106_13575 [Lyngbya sp. PCC 8106]